MLLHGIIQAGVLDGATTTGSVGFSCADYNLVCPGSAFTAIGAAFATEGYFLQSDIIHYILSSDMGLWAPLLYILAAAAGMLGVAIGMPPKHYMWFFLGPAFYYWLIATPEAVHATEWRVSDIPQDQREVWKLAEVGLLNTRIVKRLSYRVSSDKPPQGGPYGDGTVDVAYFFAWYDSVISETVQWLIRWTGVYDQASNDQSGAGGTNIWREPMAVAGGSMTSMNDLVGGTHWHLLSNLKWSLLEDITSAQVHTADLRDAFITFMSSECGDELAAFVDTDKFVASQTAGGANVPDTIFRNTTGGQGSQRFDNLHTKLQRIAVPVIPSIRNLVRAQRQFYVQGEQGILSKTGEDNSNLMSFLQPVERQYMFSRVKDIGILDCASYFNLVMNGFRWEAGHAFYQMVTKKMPLIRPEEIVYGLFYGWGIRACSNGQGQCNPQERTQDLNSEQQANFLKDLIFVYLIRNEMRMSPKIFSNPRFSNASKIEDYTKTHMRTIGEKSKYGEIFTWSSLVPYVQGVLLYMLALGYPLACILIVVPGWHKTLFTWMSFWAWAKLWDVGFAVVMVIERSIWAMIGNSSDAQAISSRITDLQFLDTTNLPPIDFSCSRNDLPGGSGKYLCLVPRVCDGLCGINGGNVADFKTGGKFTALVSAFDRALTLTANLDLDLSNAYYIYIMAALYLAVPAVTGQLVLGAKAGVAGMVGTMIGGVSGEAGRAAGSAFSSDMTQKAKSAGAALGQTGYLKGLRGAQTPMLDANGNVMRNADGSPRMMSLMSAGFEAGNSRIELGALGMLGGQLREQFGHRQAVIGANYNGLTARTAQYANSLGLTYGAGSGAGRALFGQSDPSSGGSSSSSSSSGATGAVRRGSTSSVPIGGSNNSNPQNQPNASGNQGGATPPGTASPATTGSNSSHNSTPAGSQSVGERLRSLGGAAGSFAKDNAGEGIGRVFNASTAIAGGGGAILREGVDAAVNVGYHQESAANAAGQARASQITFLGQAQEQGYGQAQQRLTGQAHFTGENEAWTMKNDYANALAGDLAAMGVSAAVLDPGPKPVNYEGAAMSGWLDSDKTVTGLDSDGNEKLGLYQMAHFSDGPESAYFAHVNASFDEMSKDMNLKDMWHDPTMADARKLYEDYLGPNQKHVLNTLEGAAGLFMNEPVTPHRDSAGKIDDPNFTMAQNLANTAANFFHGNPGGTEDFDIRANHSVNIFARDGQPLLTKPEVQGILTRIAYQTNKGK